METLIFVAVALAGSAGGYLFRQVTLSKQQRDLQAEKKRLAEDLEAKRKDLLLEAKDEALKIKEAAKREGEAREKDLRILEQTLRKREELLDKRASGLDDEVKEFKRKEESLEALKEDLRQIRVKQEQSLERIAKISKDEAKQVLLDLVEKENKEDLNKRIAALERQSDEEIDRKARKVIVSAIERLAADQTAEITTSTVAITSEEMKGRIIGKEGRNIQAFEKATGVDVIIDETPDAITLSSFDPVRRHVASLAMARLVKDGRIHPARIEEVVQKVEEEVQAEIRKAGEEAAYESGVLGLPPELTKILGSLKFRTSYGQNQLSHSIEVANIAGLIADEIGADPKISRTAALLHDIGKAVDHDVPGPHHHISGDIARKYGIDEAIIHAIIAHHDDVPAETVEAFVVKTADAISGARPGARRESLEHYLQRMKELENIVNSFSGVEKSYAIQAGREIRVLVKPEKIDDLTAIRLARDVADKIEADMSYPGQIKVTLIRETRAVEYAR